MKESKKKNRFSELKLHSGSSSEIMFNDLSHNDSVMSFLVQFFKSKKKLETTLHEK